MAPSLIVPFYTFLLVFTSASFGQILYPVPSGKYAVGYGTTKLVDESRVDLYDPNHGKRNLMISLFYPLERDACEETCAVNVVSPQAATFLGPPAASLYGLPNGTVETIKMQICCKTCASGTKNVEKFPVVLFSPGLGSTRLLYNHMAQTLASAGYAVVTLDHTFEAIVVEFPDGTLAPGINMTYWGPDHPERYAEAIEIRVQDAQFVLTQLGRKDVVESLVPGASGAFDIKRVAFYGHSLGGATAISTLSKDQRLVGAINMDGSQFGTLSDIYQPALYFGRADPSSHNRTDDETWATAWDHLKGWRRELGLRNSTHLTFGDAPLVFKLLGVPLTDAVKEVIGGLDPARSFEVITTYVQAFMDFVLKGQKSELFDRPSDAYPEVRLD